MKINNIFSNIPESIPEEIFDILAESEYCKIERIISKGQKTPEGKWYDQDKNEFVIIIKGYAKLSFKDKIIKMEEGDWINIPAHTKHRVEKTNPEKETIWLAIYYK